LGIASTQRLQAILTTWVFRYNLCRWRKTLLIWSSILI